LSQADSDTLVEEFKSSIERVVGQVNEKVKGLVNMAAWRAVWLHRVCGFTKECAVRCATAAVLRVALDEAKG
jgi:hypothetical protein